MFSILLFTGGETVCLENKLSKQTRDRKSAPATALPWILTFSTSVPIFNPFHTYSLAFLFVFCLYSPFTNILVYPRKRAIVSCPFPSSFLYCERSKTTRSNFMVYRGSGPSRTRAKRFRVIYIDLWDS